MNVSSAEFIQAVRGPVMLITLGVLVAVHQFGMLRFSTTWPVLIIVFGLLKLLERMVRQPAYQPPYPPPPAGTGYIPPGPTPQQPGGLGI